MHQLSLSVLASPHERIKTLLLDWRDDSANFLRHDVPKILLIIIGCVILIRLLRATTRGMLALRTRRLPPGLRTQQIQTLASVIDSIGTFIIVFVATLQVLPYLGLNLGPLLASAGIAGLAIGFGAQTLVHDFINGFFVLLEDQYNIGDTIRVAGVKGAVEDMTLRRTVLRDDDGTVHIIPNSQIQIVSNMTRDWAQIAMKVVVAYSEPSDKIVGLLQQVGSEIRHDSSFEEDIVSDVQVPGIDRVGNGEAEYLLLVKTKPGRQYAVSRELRRRIKQCFEKNSVETALPGRVYVRDLGTDGKS
jgi:small conductance mechanosensitive channel